MIGVIFKFGNEIIEVRVIDKNVYFRTSNFQQFVDVDGLNLDKNGVEKEFPDLKGNNEWRKIAIERFKEKIKTMDSETQRIKYIIEDLTKYGYVPIRMQRQGHRPIKL